MSRLRVLLLAVAAAITGHAQPLTLDEAIRLGLKNNLSVLLSDQDSRAARGLRLLALSQLMPRMDARVAQSSIQANLAAYGFASFPGISSIVGPYSLFDARAAVSQSVLNIQSLNRSRASEENERATAFDGQNARDTVVLIVTALYLDASAGSSRIEAAEARVAAAKALYDQAVSFKQSGVVAGIDVLRAEVQWRAQRQHLIAYRNDFEKQKLRLAQAIGRTDGSAIKLADAMPAADASALPKAEEAIGQALATRNDYRSLQTRVRAAELARRAASAGRLPTVGFNADYGAIGKAPNNSHGTFTASVALNVPVFDGGRVKAEETEADAALARLKAQVNDLRSRIELDVRSAELDLQAAGEQLEVARGNVDLARRQQEQARDRFAAGVTSNLEVVQAQEAVAAADETLIASLYASNLAKAALARAIGSSEKNIPAFLKGAK